MRYTILVLLILILSTLFAAAQNIGSVKGAVTDSASNVKLENSTISILDHKDSTLVSFTRATSSGEFNIEHLPRGKFIMLITYPEYADYAEEFVLDSVNHEINFGTVNLILKSKLLAEVIIKARPTAIKIKGDTTEYNAAAFTVQPNAKVEDLLKQFPGIQIDKDGKITAQGETVNKVLVDGEEFFGDDPTLVTKNIRADMVDKVQLYDKKSDQATFTGIDDGQKTKTLNIKLKEDKKTGSFGKADVGIATKDFYQAQLLFNTFRGKKKFSAYGTLANTGKIGLNWQDNNKYTGGANMEFMDGGGIMIMSNTNDDLESFNGTYNNEGIPVARTGGVHYDAKWGDDKYSINANYKAGSLTVDGSKVSLSENILADTSVIKSNTNQTFHNFIFRQKADGMYQAKLDTSSNLKITFDGTLKNNETIDSYISENRIGNRQTFSNRDLTNKGDQNSFNATIFYNKRFKPGRTISVNIAPSVNQSSANGFLKSDINYYNNEGARDSTVHIDQYKVNDIKSAVLNSNITYTEPLFKSLSLTLNYGLGINNATADRKTFSPSSAGKYDVLVDTLSSDYKLNQLSNQAGAVFNFKQGKSNVTFGTRAALVNFTQRDLYTGNNFERNFTNWFPQASFNYKFKERSSAWLYYNGNTTQPTIDQIQPIRNNNDPLNITKGNPDLTPSFTNSFNLGYSSYKVLTEQYFRISGNYSFVTNPITSNTMTDTATTRTVYQFTNLAGKKPANFYFSTYFDRRIKKLDIGLGLDLNLNGSTYYNMINNELSFTKSYTYSGTFNVQKYKYLKYSMYVSFGPNYTINETSTQKDRNNNGRGFNTNGSFSYFLPLKMVISTDINYQFRAKTPTFNSDFHLFIWNASLTKVLNKQDNFRALLTVNDLLNKNTGFNRNAYGNIIMENRYTTIRRYFILSLVYDFNKMGGSKAK
ncbi:TonB-dependent receptor [Mucilaginibacter limnophilus]|uniref:TonB-dependent receptor n=1 Tax=Mucilaginibacter limnophilus TaxID=1932778 RepID=A0A3S3TEH0_9SPHI|nr:outer membrane beta-barrel protein [Mucilaginibacter limnophilus]RVT97297.1 TonB-dependent receptor [Mucilaginibacter limnophilus]